jgi:hypothetical protein
MSVFVLIVSCGLIIAESVWILEGKYQCIHEISLVVISYNLGPETGYLEGFIGLWFSSLPEADVQDIRVMKLVL